MIDYLPSQYTRLTQYVNTLVNQLGSDRKDVSLIEYYPNLTLHNNPAYKIVYLSTKKVGVYIGMHYETMRPLTPIIASVKIVGIKITSRKRIFIYNPLNYSSIPINVNGHS